MRQILFILLLITLASCNIGVQSKAEPVIIETPPSKPTNFETNDSSFLKIKIQKESYQISFLNGNLSVNTIEGLDSFLRKNNHLINKENVLVTGEFTNTEKDKKFVDLLSKFGVSKFRVNTP